MHARVEEWKEDGCSHSTIHKHLATSGHVSKAAMEKLSKKVESGLPRRAVQCSLALLHKAVSKILIRKVREKGGNHSKQKKSRKRALELAVSGTEDESDDLAGAGALGVEGGARRGGSSRGVFESGPRLGMGGRVRGSATAGIMGRSVPRLSPNWDAEPDETDTGDMFQAGSSTSMGRSSRKAKRTKNRGRAGDDSEDSDTPSRSRCASLGSL